MTKPDARESCEEGHLKYGQKGLVSFKNLFVIIKETVVLRRCMGTESKRMFDFINELIR